MAVWLAGFTIVVFTIVFGVLPALFGSRSDLRRIPDGEAEAAQELGLTHDTRHRLTGHIDDHFVVVYPPAEEDPSWSVIVELPFAVPEGFWIRATPEVDGVEASHEARTLAHRVEVHIASYTRVGFAVQVRSFVTVTRSTGAPAYVGVRPMGTPIRAAIALARALDQARFGLLEPALERMGLPTHARHTQVEGEIDGIRIELGVPGLEDGAWQTRIVGHLSRPLPHGTELVSAELPRDSDLELGDLFLDQPLHVTTSDVGALRARIARDEIRGALLDFVCTWPGSVVLEDRVMHVVKGLDVSAALDRVLELVALIDGRAPGPARL